MTNPKCPYCGQPMTLCVDDYSDGTVSGAYYECCLGCKATSPYFHDSDAGDPKAAALAAAMQRYVEPSKLLTLAELGALDGTPVWCEDRDGSYAWAFPSSYDERCTDSNFEDWEYYCYGWTNERGWRAWLRKPTDEERSAAPWSNP